MRQTMGMAALGKMLTTYKPKGKAPTTGVIKTNTVKGSVREGKQYIDVTDASGITVHRYGTEGDDVAFRKGAPKVTAQSAQVASPSTAPAAKPKPKGGLTNQIKTSARFGKTYKVVTKNGMSGHLYSDGTFVAMGKAKS